MSKQELRVPVASGKYTFVSPADDYRIHVLRYGEPWHGPQGEASNAIFALMAELDAARMVLQAAREVARDPTRPLREIYDAVERHDRLVGDHEPPSSWSSSAASPAEGLEDPNDLAARLLGVKAERSDLPVEPHPSPGVLPVGGKPRPSTGSHLVDGEFQSDKYPTCPRGKVPLSVRDPTAQDLLWEYAQRRRAVDAGFSDDLETALRAAGYAPP